MPADVDAQRLVADLDALVRVPSVNPAFGGGTGEAAVASQVEALLAAAGIATESIDAAPGRTSVVGTLRGTGSGPRLMLYAHLDTVDAGAMRDPFAPHVEDGRMYGRGAYDMKCGLAACIEAARVLAAGPPLRGDVVVAAVADEEEASIGMQAVLERVHVDAAIVTEPTELDLVLAHRGFSWVEVVVQGRAAHGSRFDLGIDANMRMGRFLARLETLERDLRARAPHPLAGPPSLHAALLRGGTGPSIYAAECRLQVERRTAPGETEAHVVAELQAIVDALHAEDSTFQAAVRPLLTRPAFEVRSDAPIVRSLASAAERVLGAPPRRAGAPFWMDAAILAERGVDTVVIGPTGGGAHADVEWVELDSVVSVARILVETARDFCA